MVRAGTAVAAATVAMASTRFKRGVAAVFSGTAVADVDTGEMSQWFALVVVVVLVLALKEAVVATPCCCCWRAVFLLFFGKADNKHGLVVPVAGHAKSGRGTKSSILDRGMRVSWEGDF